MRREADGSCARLLDEQNLVLLLYSVPWPPQGLYFKKEVNAVADMAGIKFRAYNTATARLAELDRMLPVQIEAAETEPGLSPPASRRRSSRRAPPAMTARSGST